MLKNISAAILVLLLLNISACAQKPSEDEITVKQLHEKMETDSSLVILDVRNPDELVGELGQIEGVINIPLPVLEKRMNELNKYKNNNIAVVCRSGRRSGIATDLLNENGFKAKNILGGMIEYRKNEK